MALRRSFHSVIRVARVTVTKEASLTLSSQHRFVSSGTDADEVVTVTSTKRTQKKRTSSKSCSDEDSVKPSKDHDSLLIKSLKKQISEVSNLAQKFQTEVRGSFKPFEVVPNESSSSYLTLRRLIGKEEILVKCLLDLENPHVEGHDHDDDSENDHNDDELKISHRLTMNIRISKDASDDDQPKVAVLCSYAKGESITIEDIAYLGNSVHEEYAYSGPYYQDLDDKLKQGFQNIIKTRGINSGLADTITEYLSNQYQDEYIEWLKRLRDFLNK